MHTDGTRLYVPKVGWVRLSGIGQFLGCRPKQVRVLKEGTERHPKGYAHVFYEVLAYRVKPPVPGPWGLTATWGR